MDEHLPEPSAEQPPPPQASENPDPPRPVRGILWVLLPAFGGAAIGAAWSAYYAAALHIDLATPIWVCGAVGLGVGAFLWAAFPYKRRPRKGPNASE
jgi:hypothetical protein